MPSVYDRIMALWYSPKPLHEQRQECFMNLSLFHERLRMAQKQDADAYKKVYTEYDAEYKRCEPIMKIQ